MDAARLAARYFDDISNEPDPGRRRAAITELFDEDVRYSDQDGVVVGRDAFAARIDHLAGLTSAESRFTLRRPAQWSDDVAVFSWALGVPDRAPSLTGTDVAIVEDGRIVRLAAVVDDDPPGDHG